MQEKQETDPKVILVNINTNLRSFINRTFFMKNIRTSANSEKAERI